MLTREHIEIIRAEIGHDEAYNLLCDMARAWLEVQPRPISEAKIGERYIGWFADLKAWRGPMTWSVDLQYWRCEGHDIPTLWGPITGVISLSSFPAPTPTPDKVT